jgi:hypothetical protein
MPFVLPRQFTLDGKPLSAGKIFFYQSGTMTPKQTFSVPDKSSVNTNPVILDAAGFWPIYLDTGTYKVIVQDQYGVQIEQPMDGITGSGGGFGDGTVNVTSVLTYNDLRNLSQEYDLVYVGGRNLISDGGEGWFYNDQNSQLSDDDGYILTSNAGTTKYIRLNQNTLDPRFYGVVYGSVSNQYQYFLNSVNSSVVLGLPVLVNGNIYINQNIIIPTKANIIVTEIGVFSSSSIITMTFTQYSDFSTVGTTFSQVVNPIFQSNVVESIKLSWMGGTIAEDKLGKFLSSPSNTSIAMVIDTTLTVSTSTIYLLNPISFINNSYLTITGTTLDLTFSRLICDKEVIFQFPNMTSGVFNFGPQFVKPEIFGATGVISYNAWKEVYCALMTGKCYLTTGQSYSVQTTLPTLPTNVEINGGGTLQLTNGVVLNVTNLTVRDITITTPTSVSWATITYLEMFNCVIPSLYTATTQIVDGVTYSNLSTNPSYAGSPSIYNGYLPLLPNSRALETDGTGKIIQGSAFKYDLNNWHCGGYFPHYEGSSVIGFSIEYPTSGSGYIWATSSRGRVDRSATTFNRPAGDVFGFWTERLIPVPAQLVAASGWACQAFKALGSLYIMFVKSFAGTQYLLTIWSSTTPFDANSWTLQYQGAQVANNAITWDFDYIARDGNILYASAGSYSPGVTYKVSANGTVTTKSGGSPNLMRIIGYDYDNHKILASASISSVSNFGISSDDGFTWTWFPIADANIYGAAHCTGTIYSIGGYKPSWNIPGYWVIDTTNGTPYFVDVYINQATPSNIGIMRAVRDSIVAVAPGNPNIILAGPRNGNGLSQKYSPYTTGYMGSIEYNEYCGEVLLGGNNNMILSGI